jgi:membrane-bound serine protease (ClpP class)
VTAGLVMAMQDFVIPDVAGAPWQVDTLVGAVLRMLGSFVGAAAGMALLAPLLPKIPIFNRVVLKTDLAAAGGFVAPGVSAELNLVNRQGVAVTELRPGGKIEIDGALYDVITDGEFIDKGVVVVVQSIEGNRIRVERRHD